MTFLLLLGSLALAQDTGLALDVPEGSTVSYPALEGAEAPETAPTAVEAPSLLTLRAPPALADGIALIPGGSLVLIRDEDGSFKPQLVPGKAVLMPELMYDNARLKARQLDICQPALDTITEETLRMADQTYAALSKCSLQFDTDEILVADLTGKLQSMETRALVAEDRLKTARKNTAVAWAITGGLVLGATSAIVLTVAN